MSFWSTDDGEDIKKGTDGSFDAGGGSMELIPDGTSVLAYIDEAKWDRTQNLERYISLRWAILAPDELKNRKVFQKLWVLDDDPRAKDPVKKRDKAKRMLAAIDMNAGGKLMKGEMPTDESMTLHLTNKPMVVKVVVWEQQNRETGEMARGNWIGAVAPKNAEQTSSEALARAQAALQKRIAAAPTGGGSGGGSRGGMSSHDMDDGIPF